MLLDHLTQVMPDGRRIATGRMTDADWRELRNWLVELKETDHEKWRKHLEECERSNAVLVEEINDMKYRIWREHPEYFRWTDDIEDPPDKSDEGE